MSAMKKYIWLIVLLGLFFAGCFPKDLSVHNMSSVTLSEDSVIKNTIVYEDFYEIKDEKGTKSFVSKNGKILFREKDALNKAENESERKKIEEFFSKEYHIADGKNNIIVGWSPMDSTLSHFVIKENRVVTDRFLYRKGKILNIDTIKTREGLHYFVKLSNNKFCCYRYKNKGLKFFRINNAEDSVCINDRSLPDFFFVTHKGEIYKANIKKQENRKLIFKIDNINDCRIYPFGTDGFFIIDDMGYYAINGKCDILFYSLFEENEYFDSIDVLSSKNGRYFILEKTSVYQKNNETYEENIITLYNAEEEKELWTKGSLFRSLNCLALSEEGDIYVRDKENIVRYSRDYIPEETFEFKGKIVKTEVNDRYIYVFTDKNIIYSILI